MYDDEDFYYDEEDCYDDEDEGYYTTDYEDCDGCQAEFLESELEKCHHCNMYLCEKCREVHSDFLKRQVNLFANENKE